MTNAHSYSIMHAPHMHNDQWRLQRNKRSNTENKRNKNRKKSNKKSEKIGFVELILPMGSIDQARGQYINLIFHAVCGCIMKCACVRRRISTIGMMIQCHKHSA